MDSMRGFHERILWVGSMKEFIGRIKGNASLKQVVKDSMRGFNDKIQWEDSIIGFDERTRWNDSVRGFN